MGAAFFAIFFLLFIIGCIWYGIKTADTENEQTTQTRILPPHETHSYTEEEYIELYNYCVRKRNALCHQLSGTYGIIPQQRLNSQITKMDKVMDATTQEYHSVYYDNNYTKWSHCLLELLDSSEKKSINYGMLNKQEANQ